MIQFSFFFRRNSLKKRKKKAGEKLRIPILNRRLNSAEQNSNRTEGAVRNLSRLTKKYKRFHPEKLGSNGRIFPFFKQDY
jgi:hypothetical protein